MKVEETSTNSFQIFYSHAYNDESMCKKLRDHLILLRHQGLSTDGCHQDSQGGENWEERIDVRLSSTNIILLLISVDFIASKHCYDVEMQRALERDQSKSASVILILLRPVDWEAAPFAHLQVLPEDRNPIDLWKNHDLAYTQIAIAIRAIIERSKNAGSPPASLAGNNQSQHSSERSILQHAEQQEERGKEGETPTTNRQMVQSLRRGQKKVSE